MMKTGWDALFIFLHLHAVFYRAPHSRDCLRGPERATVYSQLQDLAESQHLVSSHGAQVRAEASPSELARVAAVTQLSVNDEGDDLWPAVYNDRNMVRFPDREQARVRFPAALGSTVVHHDLDRPVL